MSIQITSDNIELSPSMHELANQKLAKLQDHIPDYVAENTSYRVVMNSAPDQQFTVKIEATIKGKHFFSDETHPVLESAIIKAIEELDRQVQKEVKKDRTDDWEKQRELKRFSDTE